MSVIETIEAIRSGLMWICLSALAVIAVGIVGTWLYRGVASAMRRPLAVARIIAFVAVSAFCVIRGGAKFLMPPPSTGGTPVVPVMQSPAAGGTPVVPEVVTPEEIAQGWRLASVVTNDAVSYAMPTNGVEYMPWSLGGGYEMYFPLDLGDFAFPFGTGMVRRLDVLSGGMVESLPRQRVGGQYSSAMSICAAREWASIVPGVGRFWWAETARSASAPYQAKFLTWENVYAGRNRTGQYNAQIELRGDGNFITRSNTVERVYRRVLPYDLDNDGLPNDIDPAPEVPLVPSAWNQSEEWAVAAFPSNAAEIAAAGGYAAWAAARGADPDRRLVSLGLAFDDGGVWPTLLDFVGVPVVADGAAELVFAIDCGAKVPFTLTAGRLGSVTVTATEPPMRSGEGMTTTESSVIQGTSDYPYERMVGDVKLHLDSPRSGWMCRFAGVSIVPDFLPHIYPVGSLELEATLSCCHSNAYLGCSWYGGAGITFSHEHSLSTEATYAPDDPEDWTTNVISLVSQFVGYTLTNHLHVTVGITNVPPLRFSLGCQEVFFLNDADFLDGACTSNRPERIRPVTLNLTGPVGTNGTARLSVEGDATPVVFHVVGGVTNRVTESTEIPLAVTNDVSYTASYTVYVSCPNLGTGTITATFTPSGDDVEPLTASATFRCIEPLRKLVTTEKEGGRYVNPSRLVMWTNAVLKVDVNGSFSPSEVDWRVVSGPARIDSVDGWCATVEPTGTYSNVVVEARFNDDEIQPRFVMPVVIPRTIPVRAFVVEPPETFNQDVAADTNNTNAAWTTQEICKMLDTANEIFEQVGIKFELVGQPMIVGTTNDWNLTIGTFKDCNGTSMWEYASACTNLLNSYTASDCIEVYFTGSVVYRRGSLAATTPYGIVIGKRKVRTTTLAHELGHALGLDDCYARMNNKKIGGLVSVIHAEEPVDGEFFKDGVGDWGEERGRGFYAKEDSRLAVAGRLLMYGFSSDSRADIPTGRVLSLTRDSGTGTPDTFWPRVGESYIKKRNREVYSR